VNGDLRPHRSTIPRGTGATRFALAAIAVLAATLGLVGLGGTSLWLDEALSAIHAALPRGEFLDYVMRESHQMKFYLVILRAWRLLGESEVALRSLSVLFSVGAVVSIHALGSRLYDDRTGLVAALILASNGFHLRYAREARAYSLAVFLVILSTLLFAAMVWRRRGEPAPRPGRMLAAGFALTSVAAAYSHSYTVLVNAAQAASLLVLPRRLVPWRALLGSAALSVVLLVPLAIFNSMDVGADEFSWIQPSGLHELHDLFLHLTGYAGSPALWAYAVLVAAAAAEPLRRRGAPARPAAAARRAWLAASPKPADTHPFPTRGDAGARPERSEAEAAFDRFRLALLVGWLVIPVGVVFAASYLRPLLVPRYLIMTLPALALLAAAGLTSIRRPLPFGVALVAFLVTALPGLAFTYRKPYEEDWKGAAAHVLSRAREGDGIVFHSGAGRQAFDWYRGRLGAGREDPPSTLFPARPMTDVLDSLPDGVSRVWLVLSLGGADDRAVTDALLDPRLRGLYPSVEEWEFPRILVRLYAQPQERSP
jgi:4-amino-4-deoxy-L-arabinose transferase-like glycosyltransferase